MVESCLWNGGEGSEGKLPPPSILPESVANSQNSSHPKDIFLLNYKEFYDKRLDYLQRMKVKYAQTCSKSTSTNECTSQISEPFDEKFARLQRNLLCLMENDVTLLGQLVALSESVDELKACATLSPASSCTSLTDIEDDTATPRTESGRLTVTSDSCGSSTEEHAPALYFSRKNSVLRIPIPPSHRSTRFRTITSIASCEEEDTSSGVCSSASSSAGSVRTSGSRTRQRKLRLSIAPTDESGTGSGSSSGHGSPNKPVEEVGQHRMQDSIDSGISGMIHLAVQHAGDAKEIEVYV